MMQAVYFGLYLFSEWLLDDIERARGSRFKNRQAVFFGIILLLALITFQLIDRLDALG